MFPHCGNEGCHTRIREKKTYITGHEWHKQTADQQKPVGSSEWLVVGYEQRNTNKKKQGKVEQYVTRATAVLR